MVDRQVLFLVKASWGVIFFRWKILNLLFPRSCFRSRTNSCHSLMFMLHSVHKNTGYDYKLPILCKHLYSIIFVCSPTVVFTDVKWDSKYSRCVAKSSAVTTVFLKPHKDVFFLSFLSKMCSTGSLLLHFVPELNLLFWCCGVNPKLDQKGTRNNLGEKWFIYEM